MKASSLTACLFLALIIGCNQKQPPKAASTSTTLQRCYTSTVEQDSARLTLNEINGTVEGDMQLIFAKKEHMDGQIKGTFKGDTLFADYSYKLGGGKETFKNPAVFLRKDGKLYQGYGKLLTYLGRTYFDQKTPITFDRGFVFEQADCK